MENIIEVSNLTYKMKTKVILKDITFTLREGDIFCIIGPTGSGKSTLGKLLVRDTSNQIKISQKTKKEYVTPTFNCKGDTVYEYVDSTVSKEEVKRCAKELGIIEYLDCRPSTLSYGIQCLLQLLKALLQHPDILILDSILDSVDALTREKVIKYLKKMNRIDHTTIIYITENIEDILFFKKIMILNNGYIQYYGTLESSLKKEDIWRDSHLSYPFEIELSKKLKYYGLVDKPLLSIDKLVDTLWK